MIRRRLYGGEKLAAYALVAPVDHVTPDGDRVFFTPYQIVQRIQTNNGGHSIVNIVSKFNNSSLKDKIYGYTIPYGATSIQAPTDIDLYYNCYENNKLVRTLAKGDANLTISPTSENCYVIATGTNKNAICLDGEWLFCGKCIYLYCSKNHNVKYVYYNYLEYLGINGNGDNTFLDCKLDGEVFIPKNITIIPNGLFLAVSGLKGNLFLHKNIEYIGSRAFEFTGNSGKFKDGKLIFEVEKGTNMSRLKTIGVRAFYNVQFKGDLNMPDSITSIDSQAFFGCKFDGELHISKEIKTMGGSSLSYMSNILSEKNSNNEIIIPNNITNISRDLFSYDTKFDGILKIPSRITSIGYNAFLNTAITKVDLSESTITKIENSTFSSCKQLKEFIFPTDNKITSIGKQAFNYCPVPLNIPEGVTTIGELALSSRITSSLSLPSSVTSIGTSCFLNANITDLYLNWEDNNIISFDINWNLAPGSVTTLHVPSGQIPNYKAKGYTEFNIVEN